MQDSVQDWIRYVFDHAVTDPEWYWDHHDDELDPPFDPARTVVLIAETCEKSEVWLTDFTDAQVNQGLWYLISWPCHVNGLVGEDVDESLRVRALRSFLPLFRTTMARRCTPHLAHLDEPHCGDLNGVCYMWWDLIAHADPYNDDLALRGRSFDMEALSIMQRILTIEHDACRESALHGLGHWQRSYPNDVASIIDAWLSSPQKVRDELRHYAESAREGKVL